MNHIYHKLVVQFSINDFLAGFHNGVCFCVIQQFQLMIRQRTSLFHVRQRLDQIRVRADGDFADGEVFQRAQGMHAVISVRRHVTLAEQIMFHSGIHICSVIFRDCMGLYAMIGG